MQSGKLNEESFPHVLRGISQRRKQGALELNFGDISRTIFFISGKIVEVRDEGLNEHDEVASLLLGSGLIESIPEDAANYGELFEALGGAVPQSVFERVVLHRILDKLYEIDLKKGGFFSFTVQMVDIDRDYTPALSVGSFLLDLVSLADQQKLIDDKVGSQTICKSDAGASGSLSDLEWLVLEYLDFPIDLTELKQKTMLSSFAINEAVLNLLDNKGISIGEERSVDHLDELLKESEAFKKPKEAKVEQSGEDETSSAEETPKKEVKKAKVGAPSEVWSTAFSVLLLASSLILPALLWGKIWTNF